MKKNARTESLGTRLKGYERDFETRIDAKDFIVCRIDGYKFSKYTKGFKKPFDGLLSKTFVKTSEALVEQFGAVTGYQQSDEISLIFAPQFKEKLKPIESFLDIQIGYAHLEDENIPEYRIYDGEDHYIGVVDTNFEEDEEGYCITTYYISDDCGNNIDTCTDQGRNPKTRIKTEAMFAKYLIKEVKIINEQIFGGRVQKMASLIASFTSMKFNQIFSSLLFEEFKRQNDSDIPDEGFTAYYSKLKDKVGKAWFDARLYGVESKEEAFNSVLFRTRDCIKNSYSMFAQTYVSHKSLLNKNGPEQIAYCLQKTGKDWNDIDDGYKYGFLTKRETYEKVVNLDDIQVFSDVSTVTRTRTVTWAEPLTTFSDEKVDMIVSKLK